MMRIRFQKNLEKLGKNWRNFQKPGVSPTSPGDLGPVAKKNEVEKRRIFIKNLKFCC